MDHIEKMAAECMKDLNEDEEGTEDEDLEEDTDLLVGAEFCCAKCLSWVTPETIKAR